VVFDAADLPAELGIRLAGHLGFSETVFIDEEKRAAFRIFTPASELRLAGHPTVGTAWVLGERAGAVPQVVRPRLASEVPAWRENTDEGEGEGESDRVWIRGAVADAQPWEYVQLDDPAEIDALVPQTGPDPVPQRQHHQFWAWIDEQRGIVRARTFCTDVGVPEDEATGSAAIHLAHGLARPITIRQGRGSIIEARPAATAGWIEIGGRVVSDGFRAVSL